MCIIQDTREQIPLDFSPYGIKTISKKLDTGDYTFLGLEDIICIERKRNICELALNIGKDWIRFAKELDRMQTFQYRYIICDFSSEDIDIYPNCVCVPKKYRKYIKIRPKFIHKRIEEIRSEYEIEFLFCGSSLQSEQVIMELYDKLIQK